MNKSTKIFFRFGTPDRPALIRDTITKTNRIGCAWDYSEDEVVIVEFANIWELCEAFDCTPDTAVTDAKWQFMLNCY